MRLTDLFNFSSQTLLRQRFQGIMILCAMGLGVASVIVLTALGEGARGYVMNEFSSLGNNVLVMFPGRKETSAGMPPIMGSAARDITLEEVSFIQHRIPSLEKIAPLIIGSSLVAYEQRSRDVLTFGTTDFFLQIHHLTIEQGRSFSNADIQLASSEVIIGTTLKKALFDNKPAVGEYLRIGNSRFRIVGVIKGEGAAMGVDLSDAVVIPVAAAQRLFNVSGMFRVLMVVKDGYSLSRVKQQLEETMQELHQGELDITIISNDAMLKTFGEILNTMTLGIGAIGAISLLVAGILIMNVMLISISQRTREIGLLKALGASSNDILRIFLSEALLMTSLGAIAGTVLGVIIVYVGCILFPDIPFRTPVWAFISAIVVSLITGLAFSWLPAKRASVMQPVLALQKP